MLAPFASFQIVQPNVKLLKVKFQATSGNLQANRDVAEVRSMVLPFHCRYFEAINSVMRYGEALSRSLRRNSIDEYISRRYCVC